MEGIVNELRQEAISILLDETFRHVHKQQAERYELIALANAKIRKITAPIFIYEGKIYPSIGGNGALKGAATPLHFELYNEMEEALRLPDQHGYTDIKNFFAAVMNVSYNEMVLDDLLPTVLVNRLRTAMDGNDFAVLNRGGGSNIPVSKEQTKNDINELHEHYYPVKERLQNLLMEKLLLQEC